MLKRQYVGGVTTEIKCNICHGSGFHYGPEYGDTPTCDGYSKHSEDQPRNGTCITLEFDTPAVSHEALMQALRDRYPRLQDVRMGWNFYVNQRIFDTDNYRTTGTFRVGGKYQYTMVIDWVNPDYAERLALDQKGELYPIQPKQAA